MRISRARKEGWLALSLRTCAEAGAGFHRLPMLAAVGAVLALSPVAVHAQVTVSAAVVVPVPPTDIPDSSGNQGNARTVAVNDAATAIANMLSSASGGVSGEDLLSALESAAEAGQPMAMWRLGVMYENGEGVEKDEVKAFSYFSRIANDNANTPPRSIEADIVAQSFVKVGEYYRDGLPDAGIKADSSRSRALLMHAASYFGDADAQYRVGLLYLQENELGMNALQGARWLSLAARKGHGPAQATLGDLLFNGNGVEAQPVEGLMWLTIADRNVRGTVDEVWVHERLTRALSVATPEQRTAAASAADELGHRFIASY